MIRFRTYGSIPRSIEHTKVYHITSRTTLYGFHKLDHDISKTNLLCFTEQKHAQSYIQHLQQIQDQHAIIERCAIGHDTLIPSNTHAKGLRLPLQIDRLELNELQKLCTLHHFDMYVAFDYHYQDDENCNYLHCYVFETKDIPHRAMQILYLESMLRGL